jgi:hypothetical protein
MIDDDPIDRFLSAIPGMPRPILDRLVDQMIDRMNIIDGDPDLELNGDEHDGSMGEDDFHDQHNWRGEPGCPVSDPGGCEHDGREIDYADEWGDPLSAPPEGARKSREAHKRRIQTTRCVPVVGGEYVLDGTQLRWRSRVAGYRLKKQPSPLRRVTARLRKRKRRR